MPFSPSSRALFALRLQLARRLGLIALAGWCGLALMALILLAASIAVGFATAAAIAAGEPWLSALCSLLAIGALLAAWQCLRLLWVPAQKPEGVALDGREVQALQSLIDDFARRLGTKSVRHILVTAEMNAQLHQATRWGLWPPRTTLLLGLPLVHSLSPSQFEAVVAHELGHLAAQRGGLAALGCAVRAWSVRAMDRVSEEWALLAPWCDRLSQRYCAQLLRLARIEEYEADAYAASLVGPRVLGEALVETSLKASFLEQHFWPTVEACNAGCEEAPDVLPYHSMAHALEINFMRTVSIHALALERTAGLRAAWHPSLNQRLHRLGASARVPMVSEQSAADRYFAPLLPALAQPFDDAWWLSWQEGQRHRWPMCEHGD